ncbi:LysR family transcriptional regulator [Agrobacterium vitis]|uniref:HTH-type transcriptional regulator TtuA n=1 Tax=Agrobacterium vitis TaxID=373 RepID=A0A125P1X7_AGRVI|nr:LysR family transcriptional regulator [Agrobacterium vitis]KAA3513712.1 LysR family transcriptional regulator [Agrobacterium vitis]KAA3528293.1 LysR family transcriptional regulator [Agrobacterium vitis]MUO79801.1 LysR family transcriptional regulator [Agrobacterium vitis]MUO93710.1 LysR family transcriptional regulator [Agrobacterium vitis]MUP04039.1 LysR family transcriptional regulator [Agrobacterium vitis]
MPDLALDLRYLRYALLVAEHGSFRRAAEAIDMSQSTVSRRIQLLERRLGGPLFVRSLSGAKLTEAGARFLEEAALGASYIHEAVKDMKATHREGSGKIRIGLMTSLASGFLPNLVGEYHSRFRKVDVKIAEATFEEATAGVLSGRIDVAFLPGKPQLPRCQSVQLWNEQLFLALPRRHFLASADSVVWENVRNETFLIPAGIAGAELDHHLLRQLSDSNFQPRMSLQGVGRDNLLNMVGKGFGVSLALSSTSGSAHREVVFVPISDGPKIIYFSAVWSLRNQNPALKQFLELATEKSHRNMDVN